MLIIWKCVNCLYRQPFKTYSSPICVTFVLFSLPVFRWRGAGACFCVVAHEFWQQGCSQWTDSTFPSCHWKTSSQKVPFTTPSRPLTLIYAGSCFTVSKTVVDSLSPSQTYLGLPACDTRQNITHAAETYLNVIWLKSRFMSQFKPARSESWQTFSTPHFDALHLTAFPSAVPLIFHIRLLIITTSRDHLFLHWPASLSNQYQQAGQMVFKFSLPKSRLPIATFWAC